MLNYGFGTPKRNILAQNHIFFSRIFTSKLVRVFGCKRLEEPPPKKIAETKGCAKSCMRRNENPYRISITFCTVVGILDVIHANFVYDRLRGF